MRWLAWLVGVAVVVLLCLVFCRKPCRRCTLRNSCDMAQLASGDDE